MKLERPVNDNLNDNLIETVFSNNKKKKHELKNLVNVLADHDLAVSKLSKCMEVKTKGENGKNAAINLTTEVNRTLIG